MPSKSQTDRKALKIALEALLKSGEGGGAGPLGPNPNWLVPAWFIDPQNGSDENSGLTSGDPLKTFRRLAQILGTVSPVLRQDTTITFLSSHVDNSDPVIFKPYLANGAQATIKAVTLAPIFSGTLGGVVGKVRATGTLLQADLGFAAAPGQLLVNTRRGGRSWVYKNIAGTTFALTQPLAPSPEVAVVPPPAEIDTYANGDAFDLFQPLQINIANVECVLIDYNLAGSNGLVLSNLTIFDPDVAGDPCFVGNSHTALIDVAVERFLVYSTDVLFDDVEAFMVNCSVLFGMYGGKQASLSDEASKLEILGGNIGNPGATFSVLSNPRLDADVIIACAGNDIAITGGSAALCYVESATQLEAEGPGVRLGDPLYPDGVILWGPGNVAALSRLFYPAPAASSIQIIGTITLCNQPTGYTLDAAGTWANPGLLINATTLDAAIPAGYGGTVLDPQSGATITNRTVP